jgi:hypothetical protein
MIMARSTHPNSDLMRALNSETRSRRALATFSRWDGNTSKTILDKVRKLASESVLKRHHDTV